LHTEFAALLARADVRQAAFARLAGVTPRQVNNWCRGRAAVPKWAATLAVTLAEFTPEALAIMLEEAAFTWQETLGVPHGADADAARRAMTKLALIYHPDTGGSQGQMIRVNAAYETARVNAEDT
jgi:DNA-binding transcriptional regulator YdaS (Cro superfamily)